MSELAEEMASWVAKGDEPEVQRFMDLVERYFHEGDKPLTSIRYTDFLVTIMEVKTATREVIKKMMGTETKTSYLFLLNLYRENDD
ncbi:MAG: hypothetical protein HOP30_15220 [Cyclobacteriaceae bacterium]|nr:hypothetical protein [Cyclobacteriaceae bacterium]